MRSAFYLCQAFQYAVPVVGDELVESIECRQCADIEDAKGVDCDEPGATLASLPIRPGYWRASGALLTVHPCLHSDACKGATAMTSSNDYCADGYQGPREYRYRCETCVAWSKLPSTRPSIGTRDVYVRCSSVLCKLFKLFNQSPDAYPSLRHSRVMLLDYFCSFIPFQSVYFVSHRRINTPHLDVAAPRYPHHSCLETKID